MKKKYEESISENIDVELNNDILEEEDDEDDHFSKPVNSAFDLNLAEYPIAYLHHGKLPLNANKTEIIYTDTIRGKNGEPVKRTWVVEALAKLDSKEIAELEKKYGRKLEKEEIEFGFGGPQTLEIIYELFQLWKEQGFESPTIHVGSYYYFLRRLGWKTGGSSYNLIRKTLRCIHGIHIKAKNAVYIPNENRCVDRDFYIFPSISYYSDIEKKKIGKEFSPEDYFFVDVDKRFFQRV